MREEEVPQSALARTRAQFVEDRQWGPRRAVRPGDVDVMVVAGLDRLDELSREGTDRFGELGGAR